MNLLKKTVGFGQHELVIETGKIARQASGAVMVNMGDTKVLVTVVGLSQAKEGQDFFPLTVNYQERTYAAGKIPGGYFKRESRPTEKETLVSRLIDRPLRPLFPAGFTNEVQIIATVLSIDPKIDADIPSIIGAAAALSISGIPFNGPLAAARVGYKNGEYLLNPDTEELKQSELNLVVAGTEKAVLMVESEARELSEEVMLRAVLFGHEKMQPVIQAIKEFSDEVGNKSWSWEPSATDESLLNQVKSFANDKVSDAYKIKEKAARYEKLAEIRASLIAELCIDNENAPSEQQINHLFEDIKKEIVRGRILRGESRIDGRDKETVRPITIEVGLLPRVHGSSLFTRGETQALVSVTLGTERDAQSIDELTGERKDTFMLHYNFPPYSVGEVGFLGAPKRREIGHGRLAKRGVAAVVPDQKDFNYVIRVVSEITESNGSSSMATVCGTSLALMQAGVPIASPVAGIAMGLIKEGSEFAVLTDILGDEDHLGDMDFKVAGTEKGVTALQMDIKIDGITKEIMETALGQANRGRLHILNEMKKVIEVPREEISAYAPRITTMKIDPEKIRDVIGKGGVVIREIIEKTGVEEIDISEDGLVKVAAIDAEAANRAMERIRKITAEVEIGMTYEGEVAKILDFGAFVNIPNGKSGLVHISQIRAERVQNIHDELQLGQKVHVKVLEIDRQGRIRLSMKEAEPEKV